MCEESYLDGPVTIIALSPTSCLCPVDTSPTWNSPRHGLSVCPKLSTHLSLHDVVELLKKSNCPEKACLHSILLCHAGGVCSPKGRIAYPHEHLWFPSVICISQYPYLWLLVWWRLKFRWKWVYVKRMFLLMGPCVRAKARTVIEMKWYQKS